MYPANTKALDRLADADQGEVQIVELRTFAGLTSFEVAELLAVSPGTVA